MNLSSLVEKFRSREFQVYLDVFCLMILSSMLTVMGVGLQLLLRIEGGWSVLLMMPLEFFAIVASWVFLFVCGGLFVYWLRRDLRRP